MPVCTIGIQSSTVTFFVETIYTTEKNFKKCTHRLTTTVTKCTKIFYTYCLLRVQILSQIQKKTDENKQKKGSKK